MKKIFLTLCMLFSSGSVFASDKLIVSCTQLVYRIDINFVAEKNTYVADYLISNMKVAEASNVKVESDSQGNTVYSTDMGFRLTVKDQQGVFEGLWPKPFRALTLSSMICQ